MDKNLIHNSTPEVSVLMPAYNAGKYIHLAIRSILDQVFTDFELLILDDCSTDNTAEVIFSFQDTRIRYFKNDTNKGIASTRNKLIRFARGRFLALLDADDIACHYRLLHQSNFLKKNQNYVLVCSWFEIINEAGDHLAFFKEPISDDELIVSLFFFNKIAQSSAMFNASLLPHHIGLYNLDYPLAEDYELWTRLTAFGKMKMLPASLLKYRHYKENSSHTKLEQKAVAVDAIHTELFKKLKLNYSSTELNIHKSIIDWDIRKNENVSFSDMKAWLLKVKDANTRSGLYPPSALDNIIADILILFFNTGFRKFHPALLPLFLKKMPSKMLHLKAIIAVVLKCLIGYRPTPSLK